MREQAVLKKIYDPGSVEKTWYAFWEEKGYFKPEYRTGGKPFSITIPPPNVTGELHMGHALQHAVHDAVVRWKRMLGHRTLCLPRHRPRGHCNADESRATVVRGGR